MSKSEKTTVQYSGLGFSGALTLLFIALKLTSVIDWSWWWVLAPTWIPLTFLLVCVVIAVSEWRR